jgi:hypothetical protein
MILDHTDLSTHLGIIMNSRFAISVLFASALTVGAVLAHAGTAELENAYQAGVAGKVCEPKLDSSQSSALGEAVQRAEQKSGLAQDDLDAMWTKAEQEARADNAAFCAKASPLVEAVIKAE